MSSLAQAHLTKRILVAGLGAILLAAAFVARTLDAGPQPACGTVEEGSIVESDVFTPAANRMTAQRDYPLRWQALADATVPVDRLVPSGSLAGRQIRVASVSPDGSIFNFYLDRPFDEADTFRGIIAAGAILFERFPFENGRPFYEDFRGQFPERAMLIELGPLKGTLTWGDPFPDGTRPHSLVWADDRFNYRLIADMSAASIVSLGRSIVCTG